MRPLLLLAAALSLFAGAASAAPRACPAGLHPATTAELFFGGDAAGATPISNADWRGFVDAEVKTRFALGVAASDVYAQPSGPGRGFVRQPAQALVILLTGAPDESRRLD